MNLEKKFFSQDNYAARHTTGHNMHDPESLLTGREIAKGLTYDNSHRIYPSEYVFLRIISGEVPSDIIEMIAPRVMNDYALGETIIPYLSEA